MAYDDGTNKLNKNEKLAMDKNDHILILHDSDANLIDPCSFPSIQEDNEDINSCYDSLSALMREKKINFRNIGATYNSDSHH